MVINEFPSDVTIRSQPIPRCRPSHFSRWLAVVAALGLGSLLISPAPVRANESTAAEEAAADVSTGPSPEERSEAAYHFALAKLLAEENAFEEALAAYDRALELVPGDPYTLTEKGKFHAYLAQLSRSRPEALFHAEKASDSVERARRGAPENLEILSTYAQVHLQLADWDNRSVDRSKEAYEEIRTKEPESLEALIPLGQIYLWERSFTKAAEVLEAADSLRPGQRMILTMWMEALLQDGQLDEAEPVLRRLLAVEPNSLENRLRLVELLARRGDHRGALAILEEAPPEVSDSFSLRHRLARELHATGENRRALALTRVLRTEQPDLAELTRLEITILAAMGKDKEALTKLRSIMEGEESETIFRDRLLASRLLERQGRVDEAVDELRALLGSEAQKDRRQDLLVFLAGTLERQGRGSEARDLLTAELDTASGQTLVLMAGALSDLQQREGQDGAAQETLLQGIESLVAADAPEAADALRLRQLALLARAEDWPALLKLCRSFHDGVGNELAFAARQLEVDALVGLERLPEALELLAGNGDSPGEARQIQAKRIEVFLEAGRDQEAMAEVDRIIEDAQPANLYFASQLLQRSRRYTESLPLLERLLEMEPESSAALFLKGAAQERTGKYAPAVTTFERLLELVPDHPPALNYLGYMWAERGENLERARSLIERAVALDQDNGAYLDSLGWALYQLGEHEEARRHLEWAVKLQPDDPTVLEHLADVLAVLGDSERALDVYRQVRDLGGDDIERVERKLLELGSGGR